MVVHGLQASRKIMEKFEKDADKAGAAMAEET